MSRETLVLDIDTQRDFLMPDGSWPVPMASLITPSLERVARYARMYHLPVLATVQVREAGDPGFQVNGGPDPVHCVRGTVGQRKASATHLEAGTIVEARRYSESELKQFMAGREIVVETSGPDLMSNPNTERLLSGVRNAIVFGVTTDGAVMRAVQVLLNKGIAVEIVRNATAVRSAEPEALDAVLAEMVTLGARKIRDIDVMTRFTTSRHH